MPTPALHRLVFGALLVAGCSSTAADIGLDPPPPGRGFQIDQGRFSLDSGREAVYCMRTPIPMEYRDGPLLIRGVESRLPKSTHHFFMAYGKEPLDGPRPCFGESGLLEVGADKEGPDAHGREKAVFLSGVGETGYFLPAGYGLYMPSGSGHLTSSHHVLNLSDRTAELYGIVNVHTAPPSDVPHPMNVLNCLLQDIAVPPHRRVALSATCVAPFDLDVVILGSHAHQHLERFEMRRYDGKNTAPDPLYVSTSWDSPAIVPLKEPLRLKKGEGLTFTCHYNNPSDTPVSFGAGEHGEMCAIMSAYAFPKERTFQTPPSLGTIIPRAGDWMPLLDTSEIQGPF